MNKVLSFLVQNFPKRVLTAMEAVSYFCVVTGFSIKWETPVKSGRVDNPDDTVFRQYTYNLISGKNKLNNTIKTHLSVFQKKCLHFLHHHQLL